MSTPSNSPPANSTPGDSTPQTRNTAPQSPAPPHRRPRKPVGRMGMIFAAVALVGYGLFMGKVYLFGSADFVPSAQRAAPNAQQGPLR